MNRIKSAFEYHNIMKETLMTMIEKSYNDNLNIKDDYYGDENIRLVKKFRL